MRLAVLAVVISTAFALARSAAIGAESETPPPAPPGVYQVWGPDRQALALPYVMGGQIELDWKELERGRGNFREPGWAQLDRRIALYAAAGKHVTVQFNSVSKPAWVWQLVADCTVPGDK